MVDTAPNTITSLQNEGVVYDILVTHDVAIGTIGPLSSNTDLVISCSFVASGVLSVVVTTPGGVTLPPMQLNSGNALIAGSLYEFSHVLSPGETASYQYSVSTEATIFKVDKYSSQSAIQGIDMNTVISAVLVVMIIGMIAKMMISSANKKVA
jgi:hypothetical protein